MYVNRCQKWVLHILKSSISHIKTHTSHSPPQYIYSCPPPILHQCLLWKSSDSVCDLSLKVYNSLRGTLSHLDCFEYLYRCVAMCIHIFNIIYIYICILYIWYIYDIYIYVIYIYMIYIYDTYIHWTYNHIDTSTSSSYLALIVARCQHGSCQSAREADPGVTSISRASCFQP